MLHQVTVKFSPQTVFVHSFELEKTAGSIEQARQWLDQVYTELDCEPLRASGKLLTADKIIAIAMEAGSPKFEQKEWALAYSKAVANVLDRANITVDVREMAVSF